MTAAHQRYGERSFLTASAFIDLLGAQDALTGDMACAILALENRKDVVDDSQLLEPILVPIAELEGQLGARGRCLTADEIVASVRRLQGLRLAIKSDQSSKNVGTSHAFHMRLIDAVEIAELGEGEETPIVLGFSLRFGQWAWLAMDATGRAALCAIGAASLAAPDSSSAGLARRLGLLIAFRLGAHERTRRNLSQSWLLRSLGHRPPFSTSLLKALRAALDALADGGLLDGPVREAPPLRPSCSGAAHLGAPRLSIRLKNRSLP
jgi:hypothetical protein